jgi:hypothetical protein
MKGIRISSAISVHNVGTANSPETRFVITNEATGQHFSADASTVRFLDALRSYGDVGQAALRANISSNHAAGLAQNFVKRGIAAGIDLGDEGKAPSGPIEGKLISVKADLANAAGVARRLSWLGRLAFSLPAALIWGALVLFAIATFLQSGDKVTTSLMQLGTFSFGSVIAFVTLFVFVKAVHELGHILAYRVMCLREGLDPGPIRVGIMVFAATPFPFTDVTGAWRISSRWRRAMIGAGGVYFETYTVALMTLAWSRFDLGVVEPVILQVAVFSGALTLLFNLNPAIKLDGYYIMTDLFRQPNLVGRASQAARAAVGRLLGAPVPAPGRLELTYWLIAYAYRWTIFAGIFWLAYRFDPRLATVVGIVAGMLLIVRPLNATMRPLMSKVSPVRIGIALACLAILVGVSLVPFRARILADGQMLVFKTEYLFPPEAVQLNGSGRDGSPVTFTQPSLLQDKTALEVRREILANLSRGSGLTGAELAALANDRAGIEQQLADVNIRIARLTPMIPADAQLTPLDSDRFKGQWIDTFQDAPLAAVSTPSPVGLRLTLEQKRLEPALAETMQVRIVGAAHCGFGARLDAPWSEAVARGGMIEVDATPIEPVPECAAAIRNGAAVVARFPLPPRSIAERLRARVSRLLQERLPFETEA